MGASPNFALSATKNVLAGYTETVCIQCTDTFGIVLKKTAWKITQDSKCSGLGTLVTVRSYSDQTVMFAENSTYYFGKMLEVMFK